MPRHLFGRARKLRNLCLAAAFSSFVLLVALTLMPTASLMKIAEWFSAHFWINLKHISFEGCAEKCHMMAFSTVAIPISWATSIVVALCAVPMARASWQACWEALNLGFSPFGIAEDGRKKQPPSLGLIIGGVVVLGGALYGVELLLFALAGSLSTTSRAREIPTMLISVWTSVLMATMQFLVGGVMSGLVLITLHLKRRWD